MRVITRLLSPYCFKNLFEDGHYEINYVNKDHELRFLEHSDGYITRVVTVSTGIVTYVSDELWENLWRQRL